MKGLPRADKVTLFGVQEAKAKRVCTQHCLQDIDTHDVLSLHYEALSITNYEDKTHWILNYLRGFIVSPSNKPSHIKFETRIIGYKICHACFTIAIGNSLIRLKEIIFNI